MNSKLIIPVFLLAKIRKHAMFYMPRVSNWTLFLFHHDSSPSSLQILHKIPKTFCAKQHKNILDTHWLINSCYQLNIQMIVLEFGSLELSLVFLVLQIFWFTYNYYSYFSKDTSTWSLVFQISGRIEYRKPWDTLSTSQKRQPRETTPQPPQLPSSRGWGVLMS